jgi:hypothetical protein
MYSVGTLDNAWILACNVDTVYKIQEYRPTMLGSENQCCSLFDADSDPDRGQKDADSQPGAGF